MTMIVIAGGGTGGHTSPGLASRAALRAGGVACEWIGSRTGLEARRAPEAGIPYRAIRTGKLRRALAWQNLPEVFVNAPAGVLQAWRLLRRLRPRVVFATGGFVALPVALAGALARVPVVVHEQTAVPGLANRVAARVARRVAVTFAESAGFFGGPAAAALVVRRAGAGTVNECCQLGLPALYVPLPGAAGDEQTANAKLVGRARGCAILPQAGMMPSLLLERIQQLLSDSARLKEMGERARTLAVPDAADRLADLLLEIAA